jgi:hypothetical protein
MTVFATRRYASFADRQPKKPVAATSALAPRNCAARPPILTLGGKTSYVARVIRLQ